MQQSCGPHPDGLTNAYVSTRIAGGSRIQSWLVMWVLRRCVSIINSYDITHTTSLFYLLTVTIFPQQHKTNSTKWLYQEPSCFRPAIPPLPCRSFLLLNNVFYLGFFYKYAENEKDLWKTEPRIPRSLKPTCWFKLSLLVNEKNTVRKLCPWNSFSL